MGEGHVAAGKVALVGPIVGVQHAVLGQSLFARQRLAANVAHLKKKKVGSVTPFWFFYDTLHSVLLNFKAQRYGL